MPALDQPEFDDLYPLKVIKSKKDYENALKSMKIVNVALQAPVSSHYSMLDCPSVIARMRPFGCCSSSYQAPISIT